MAYLFAMSDDEFQIPEGTFGTTSRRSTSVTRPSVSNPGRNVWDMAFGAGGRSPPACFKSRKERLGPSSITPAYVRASRFQIPEGTFGTRFLTKTMRRFRQCFKSRKERLGPDAVDVARREVRMFQIPEGTFGTTRGGTRGRRG